MDTGNGDISNHHVNGAANGKVLSTGTLCNGTVLASGQIASHAVARPKRHENARSHQQHVCTVCVVIMHFRRYRSSRRLYEEKQSLIE